MIQVELNKDDILNVVSEIDIFRFYCTNFVELDKPFSSELREDPTPSCRISLWGDYYLYKDFGESSSHNCFGYVMRKFSCDYRTALNIISRDFKLTELYSKFENNINIKTTKLPKKQKNKIANTIIRIKKREWMQLDYNFWTKNYNVKLSTCDLYKIYPISHFWLNNKLYSVGISNTYAYYYYKNDIHRYKIYQPYNKNLKWISNIDNTVVQGIKNIPKSGDLLIITKSLKDVLVLRELGYNAVSPNNETSFVPEINICKFKKRFKDIIIYFDNDEAGIKHSALFAEKYDLKYIFNPPGERKDISDVIHYKGVDYAKELLHNLMI